MKMTRKQKKMLIRIIVSAVMMISLMISNIEGWLLFVLYLIPYLIIGYDILIKAAKGIWNRQIFDENFLMAIATVGALVIGVTVSGDYVEAVAVMLFYQIGELFQSYAIGKSRKNIRELMDIRPDSACIELNGELIEADPNDIEIGTVIIVRPGDRIPIDGIVVEGISSINTAALTGESIPRDVSVGDEVISGCINVNGVIHVRTTKEFCDSTVSKILDLVESASSRKSKSEDFISRFARIYTPAVCCSALMLAILPPLVNQFILTTLPAWEVWAYRALTFLVASCPCALVVSIPLSFFAGIGGASREGILIKGSNYLEALSKARCIVFDKTGTLTKGAFEVTDVIVNGIERNELIDYAAHAEGASSHPIAQSITRAYGKCINLSRIDKTEEIAGKGVITTVDGKEIAVGNEKLMDYLSIEYSAVRSVGSVVNISIDHRYSGSIIISDEIKPTAKKAIEELRHAGIRQTVMLTGDSKETADKVRADLNIDRAYAGLLPDGKVLRVEELLSEQTKNSMLVFVGDGINDAPVLSRADIGVAMGAIGSDAAIEAADVVLMDDDPLKLAKAIKISRKCLRIVKQNTVFAIAVKLISLVLVAFGLAGMWLAVFADVGVMIIAVMNAIRALFVKKL